MQQPVRRVVAVATAALVAGALVLLALPGDARDPRDVARAPSAFRAEPTTSLSPRPTSSCAEVSHAFTPRTITVAGVTRGATVVTPPRDADGVPGVPPLTTDGKEVFAWDRAQGIRPGDPAGNVLLNAHTWPDGSALGNRLLAGLHGGDRIVVQGDEARLCYRVTERVEVFAERGLARFYDAEGPPQLAIVVCSGRRLGPGEWEKRTIWFASPAA
jgi:hypothetical protein